MPFPLYVAAVDTLLDDSCCDCLPLQAMIKVVFLIAVIAVVGTKAPVPFHSFNRGGELQQILMPCI